MNSIFVDKSAVKLRLKEIGPLWQLKNQQEVDHH